MLPPSAFILLFLTFTAFAGAQETVLPFGSTDSVTVQRDADRAEQMGGRIEDISGETLTLRRNGRGDIKVLRMSDVTTLKFSKSEIFERGLQQLDEGEYSAAIRFFDRGIEGEARDWAASELQAVAVKTCIRMGDRDSAVTRVEWILERDPASRHVSLLPLVWDHRLPANERVTGSVDDLNSQSSVRQLVAASALLGDSQHHQQSVLQLRKLRTLPFKRLAELAETQLWRLPVVAADEQHVALVRLWESRLSQLPLEVRGGAQFAFARCLQQRHDYDNASVAFLWQPFMLPTDEALAAASVLESVRCLQASGRTKEAAVLRQELQTRFPDTSAAQSLTADAAPTIAVDGNKPVDDSKPVPATQP